MSVRDRDDLVVARLQQLAPHLDGEPDPAFQATTRARLVAMAAVRSPAPSRCPPGAVSSPGPTTPPPPAGAAG